MEVERDKREAEGEGRVERKKECYGAFFMVLSLKIQDKEIRVPVCDFCFPRSH